MYSGTVKTSGSSSARNTSTTNMNTIINDRKPTPLNTRPILSKSNINNINNTITNTRNNNNNINNRFELTDEQRHEIREAFELFDSDKNGLLDVHEVKVSMRALGFDIRKEEVARAIEEVSVCRNEHNQPLMDLSGFTDIMTSKLASRDPRQEMVKAFQLFDESNTGRISLRGLKRVARELGENMADEELQAMIDEFDRDGDGEINLEEFLAIMLNDD
eukprot:Tbor_TRINITY_DN5811_c3_g1::TRINITY_DN5811_c3_g1_i1::g.6949::m.6949/K16466/CETN3, CDC31; centrin-3